jgi:hypothetical protein
MRRPSRLQSRNCIARNPKRPRTKRRSIKRNQLKRIFILVYRGPRLLKVETVNSQLQLRTRVRRLGQERVSTKPKRLKRL